MRSAAHTRLGVRAASIALAICLLSSLVAAHVRAEDAPKVVLAHYMPWYASKEVSGQWGWHWTMGRFDPDRREAASHDRPLVGLYDSNDPHLLEYHALLMKFAGFDGAIVDWYGIADFRDYATLHRSTLHLVRFLKKAGLVFAVCYEDQSAGKMVEANALAADDDTARGIEVMSWLQRNWFADDAYLKLEGRPVLLVFGPQHFGRDQWAAMFADLPERPLLFALPHRARDVGADGVFAWPPVHGGREIEPGEWRSYLHELYARGAKGERVVAAAFPGFRDIYAEAGVHGSYGRLDPRGGRTFDETLDLAWCSDARIVQVVTWNDHGEGTSVEPTESHGYRHLEAVQSRARRQRGAGFPYAENDLRLPAMLHDLRKKHAGDTNLTAVLDTVSDLLFASKCGEARRMMESLADERSPRL